MFLVTLLERKEENGISRNYLSRCDTRVAVTTYAWVLVVERENEHVSLSLSLLIKIHLHSLVTLSLRFDYEMYPSIRARTCEWTFNPLYEYPSSREFLVYRALSIAIIFYLDEYPFKSSILSFISSCFSSNIYTIVLFEMLLPPPPPAPRVSSFLDTWLSEDLVYSDNGSFSFDGQPSSLARWERVLVARENCEIKFASVHNTPDSG